MVSGKTILARHLRNNPTDVEKMLWQEIRNGQLGIKFRRQYPIGPYFADFACKEKGLVIEIDGGQHSFEKDHVRTEFIQKQGFEILRFWNNDVLTNIEGVMDKIVKTINTPPLPPRIRGGVKGDF